MRILLLFLTFTFAAELEVEGDLKVTGDIQLNTVESLEQEIAQLHATIAALQAQINFLSAQLGYTDCNGVIGGDAQVDVCGECGGDNSSCSTAFDIEGHEYNLVLIGSQLWMAENLRTMTFNNGETIQTLANSDWGVTTDAAAYTLSDNTTDVYGVYYNWYAIDDQRGICPEGMHIPNQEEYEILVNYLDGADIAGGKMKEVGLEHWINPNTGATNDSGFSGLGAGCRIPAGPLNEVNGVAYFWTANGAGSNGMGIGLFSSSAQAQINFHVKPHGFSVRCVGNY